MPSYRQSSIPPNVVERAAASTVQVVCTPNLSGADDGIAETLVDLLRKRLQDCWNIPPGAREAQLIVKVHFALSRNGTVIGLPEVMNSSTDPLFLATAKSAVERCAARPDQGCLTQPESENEKAEREYRERQERVRGCSTTRSECPASERRLIKVEQDKPFTIAQPAPLKVDPIAVQVEQVPTFPVVPRRSGRCDQAGGNRF